MESHKHLSSPLITGDIAALLSRAAEAAIRTKTERITPELLQATAAKARFQ